MSKFKVLKNNETFMTHLGIYSNRLTEPTNEFFKSFVAYYFLFNTFVGIAASAAFALKYSCDLKPVLGAFKFAVGAWQFGGMFLGIGLKKMKVKSLHLELQRIVDEGNLNCSFI